MDNETLLKYLKCETSAEEEKAVLDWLDEDEAHRRELDALSVIFSAMVLNMPPKSPATGLRRPFWRRIANRAAAVAAVIALAAGVGFQVSNNRIERLAQQMVTVEVPKGHRMDMTLPDGTEIRLNAGSKLEYPTLFSSESRRVKLSGEAVFDVARDTKRPFTVNTYACDIKVLGTKFCVNADEANERFTTLLMRGCVKIEHLLTGDADIIMYPYDYVKLEGKTLKRQRVDHFDSVLWTDGIISLQDTSFEELIARFEKAYNIDIIVQRDRLPHLYCRGKIHISDGIEHAMKILQIDADFDYEYDANAARLIIR